jgi:hypothetical protein
LEALAPYKVRLADCEVTTTGPLPDHKITLRLPGKSIALYISAEGFRFTKENPYWAESEEVLKLIDLVEGLVLQMTAATIV